MKNYIKHILSQILCVGLLASTHIFSQTINNSKNIYFRVSVTDKKGQLVAGLEKGNFTVLEDGIAQQINSLTTDTSPASVLILIDVSNSVNNKIRQLNAFYAWKVIQESNSKNDYSIIAFNNQIDELADWGNSGKELSDALDKIAGLKSNKGNTIFNDAVMFAQEKLKKAKNDKKVLIIFSDGQDNSSKASFNKVIDELKTNEITVYSIGNFDGSDVNEKVSGAAILDRLSNVSGGKSFYAQNEKELTEITDRIVSDVKSRYLLGYIPKGNRNKKQWQDVEIKVSTVDLKKENSKLIVRSRQGYLKSE
ncbi:MAG TPA: VWA domain-containing protein [Pyrinomonadaceae bacterium]|jgi:Ca-activated chloride channel family protein|nr:VWA domain-containing protein [Pyrinomonadaceae bacterium]